MPYIKAKDRKRLDKKIAKLVSKLKEFDPEELEGALNYTITSVINDAMKPVEGWRYKWINRAMGVLDCVKFEFYRRLASPYEDKAVAKNGDMPCYFEPEPVAKNEHLENKQEIFRPEVIDCRIWKAPNENCELKDDQKTYRKEEK